MTEIAALIEHGRDLAERYVLRCAPELVELDEAKRTRAARPARPPLDPDHTRRVLAAGQSRFFRALKLRSPLSWAFTIAVAAGLVALAWRQALTLDGVVAAGRALVAQEIALLDWIGSLAPGYDGEISKAPIVMAGLLAAAAGWLLVSVGRLPRPRTGVRLSLTRALATARKWARAFSGNLLLGLFGLPVLVALASAVVAGVSFVAYHLPFMAAAGLRPPRSKKGAPTVSGQVDARRPRARRLRSVRP